MATLANVASGGGDYDAWLASIANSYASRMAAHGDYGYTDSDNTTTNAAPVNDPELIAKLRANPALAGLYAKGITAEQIGGAPLADSGSFDAGGFGVFGGKPYDQLTPAQQAVVDKGEFAWQANPTMQEGGGGGYWGNTDKTPGVLGNHGTAAFTPYNPLDTHGYKNPGQVGFDPNYGLVTSQSNVKQNGLDSLIYNLAPTLAIAAMTMGAGVPSMVSSGMNATHLLDQVDSDQGFNPMAFLPFIGQMLGLPSYVTTGAQTVGSIARGGKPK